MASIVDYVRTCTDTFEQRPLNRVDSLALSCLSYLWIPEEVPDAATPEGVYLLMLNDDKLRLSLTAPIASHDSYEQLLLSVASSPRFFSVRASLAAEESSQSEQRQFAAVTFRLPDGSSYVAFRGTDNTLLGWKEDLCMSFRPVVPAQEAAHAYLQRIANQVEGPLYVGGHSKGGNLAVYATMTAPDDVRQRIVRCYSHDGPGFLDETTASPSWAGSWDLVERTIPGESLVGLLLGGQGAEPIVVRSTKAGIMQHHPFSWVVEGDDFAREGALSYDAYRTGKRMNSWLMGMSASDRERFVDILCTVVRAAGEVTFSGLAQSLEDGSLALMLRRLDGLPVADRSFFLDAAGDLMATLLLGPAPKEVHTPEERAADAADKMDDITARFNDTFARWERYFE